MTERTERIIDTRRRRGVARTARRVCMRICICSAVTADARRGANNHTEYCTHVRTDARSASVYGGDE